MTPLTTPHGGRLVPPPSVDLFAKPTPTERLHGLEAALADPEGPSRGQAPAAIWAKREDLMTVGLGGNKLRNLEFLVAAARHAGADTLVTSGRGSANHCRLTAAAGARAGFRVVLVHPGPQPSVRGPGERLSQLFGAELRYASGSGVADRELLLAATVSELVEDGRRPFVIDVGASGAIGASGQVQAGLEFADQARAYGFVPDRVFVAAATGGTVAGLSVGLALGGLDTEVVTVPTHLTTAPSPAAFRSYVRGLVDELGLLWDVSPEAVRRPLEDDLSSWQAFGTPVPNAARAARLLAEREGIAADLVYTARTVAALISWAAAGRLTGQTVVLWYGGGTPALFEPEPSTRD